MTPSLWLEVQDHTQARVTMSLLIFFFSLVSLGHFYKHLKLALIEVKTSYASSKQKFIFQVK